MQGEAEGTWLGAAVGGSIRRIVGWTGGDAGGIEGYGEKHAAGGPDGLEGERA